MNVEKSVPIAKHRSCGKKRSVYPFDQMKIGDSFYIEGYSHKKQSLVSSAGAKYFERNNNQAKVITRQEGEGIRVHLVQKINQ